jgi:hypothetical protein
VSIAAVRSCRRDSFLFFSIPDAIIYGRKDKSIIFV